MLAVSLPLAIISSFLTEWLPSTTIVLTRQSSDVTAFSHSLKSPAMIAKTAAMMRKVLKNPLKKSRVLAFFTSGRTEIFWFLGIYIFPLLVFKHFMRQGGKGSRAREKKSVRVFPALASLEKKFRYLARRVDPFRLAA